MQQREAGLQLMRTSEPGRWPRSPLARTLPDSSQGLAFRYGPA